MAVYQAVVPSSAKIVQSFVTSLGNATLVNSYVDDSILTALYGYRFPSSDTLTVEKCIISCSELGFAYGAVKAGKDCICGQTIASTIIAPTSFPAIACTGYQLTLCGGSMLFQLPSCFPSSSHPFNHDDSKMPSRPYTVSFLLKLEYQKSIESRIQRQIRSFHLSIQHYLLQTPKMLSPRRLLQDPATKAAFNTCQVFMKPSVLISILYLTSK